MLAVADGAAGGLVALRAAVLAVLPFTDVDSDPFESDPIELAMISLVQDVGGSVHSLGAELARRAPAAQTALDAHTAALTPPAKVEALQECARALMGETARLVPIVTMPATAAAEWSAALTGIPTLLQHLTDDLDVDFPVEDWLHSAARVRAPVLHLEQASLLSEALGRPDQALKPIQLPRRAGDRWLALEHPANQDLTGEHLLYTAVYPVGFATATVCGLLVDEWTEVLPSDKATAGLAFNYDQPSSEAPQAMLLVTPATGGRTWTWDDLRQAVPDTMALARQRAVEPVHLDAGARARFLPATVSAVTQSGISISLALAINNGLVMKMEGGPHG